MATLKELRDERLRKLQAIKDLGIDPYPSVSHRSHKLKELVDSFASLEGQDVDVVGRVVNIRKFGSIAFLVIKDQDSKIQIFLSKDNLPELDAKESRLGFDQLSLLDSGDFIQASGKLIKTQTGEISVEAKVLKLLDKSLRPMPLSVEGFTNKEERLRRRYIDLNVNDEVKQRFVRRSKFWQATRDFLNDNGFIEINTPVLEHTTGGADATPFVTHMDALDQDFYLRISHELPLKRLIGGGFEKVYDIGPRFRNENYSEEHLPEHMAMEWYSAYSDWRDGMNMMSEMYKYVAEKTFGTTKFKIKDFEIDFANPWQELDYAQVIKDNYGIDIFNCNLDVVKAKLRDNNLEIEQSENMARGIDKLWKNIRKTINGPSWLINTPLFISPLSKVNKDQPLSVERFQPIIAGTEIGNGFSELNDPIEQLKRFKEQQDMRNSGDSEAMMLDIDYVEMLEYGMPPTCGFGYSERVFWQLENVSAREGVIFPHLRHEIDATTKSLYPEIKLD